MVTTRENGTAIFRMFEASAQRVEIRGTFTDWHAHPIAMRHVGGGWWEGEARVAQGDHEFQYLVDGVRWTTDYAASGVRRTHMGTWVSLLHVRTPEIQPVVRATGKRGKMVAA